MANESRNYRVLVIDDTPSIHEDFRKILAPGSNSTNRINSLVSAIFGAPPPKEPSGGSTFTVDSATQGEEGLAMVIDALARRQPYAVAFVDMRIPPGWDGLETIRHIWATDPHIQIVICTAYSDHSWAAISQRVGQSDNLLILKKPFDQIEVLQLAHALSRKWQLAQDNAEHVQRLDELVRRRTYQLDEAEERFIEAFNASPLAQAIVNLEESRFLNVNKVFEAQFSITAADLPKLTAEQVFSGLGRDKWDDLVLQLRAGKPIDEHPFAWRNTAGRECQLRLSARSIPMTARPSAIVVLRDVTTQIETEQQLRQSQKLEAVGQLSAGIAHDFNNLLTVIQCYISELLAAHTDQPTRQMLEPVQTAASRASSLVRQLLIFSRKEVVRPERLELSIIVAGLQSLIRRLIGTNIAIDWFIPPGLPSIEADPANLEQIIVNLVVNARDAMPNGGRITITASRVEIDATSTASNPEASPGCYVVLKVTDTGTGIPPEVLPRIYEPFFTTKAVGKGTGLGLSTVYSLVKQHGGWIQAESTVGKGTSFTIYHPAAKAPAPNPVKDKTGQAAQTHNVRRPHRVLVAEDDPLIQRMLQKLLGRYELEHVVASDGVSALSIWNSSKEQFDVLISDIMMPNGLSGVDLARTLREEKPQLAVILISGYSESWANPKVFDLPGGRPKILNKPFTVADLREAIDDVLNQRPQSG
ncbi:MAG: response regulator [Nibricoccus sp.]